MVIRQKPFYYETKEYGMWVAVRDIDMDMFALECLERQTQTPFSLRDTGWVKDYALHESFYKLEMDIAFGPFGFASRDNQ